MTDKLYTVDEVRRMKFGGLTLPEPFARLLGTIEPTAAIFVWGLPGGGKTTFALDLLSAIASVYGPALFIAGEAGGASKTIQNKIIRLKIKGDKVLIADFEGFKMLKERVLREGIRAVALDSTPETRLAVG